MTLDRAKKEINRNQEFTTQEKRTLRDVSEHTITYAGWRDLKMPTTSAVIGAGTPSLVAFGPTGNIKQYAFGIGDSVYFTGHVDHDWLVDSLAFFHTHWTTDGTNTQPVRWEVNYTIAKGHNQAAFPADKQIILTEAATGTPWQHMITEDTVGFSLEETDAVVCFEVKRVTNGGTDNTDTVFLLTTDLHYQVGQHATPQKAPNFFAD